MTQPQSTNSLPGLDESAPDPFVPAGFLPGRHAQTVWGSFVRPRTVQFSREHLETPDGDELILDHLEGPAGAPRVVMLHGLEGSSYSVYIQGMARLAAARGIGVTVINFRSCARDPRRIRRWILNRRPRLYHSGETTDFDFVIRTLSARVDGAPIVAFGASLGGNVLLKWLGENPGQTLVRAVATVSVPYDLAAGARYMETFAGSLYVGRFVSTLGEKAEALAARFAFVRERIDLEAARRSRTFYEFDNAATAPLHGFADADDYYQRSGSIGFVGRITTPALCLSAADDPFLPPSVLEEVRTRASAHVRLVVTPHGGHVGFVEGGVPWRSRYWAEETAIRFLANHACVSGQFAGTGRR